MPAEWEHHDATWLSWPQQGCNSFPDSYDRVIPTIVQMAEALAESETVRINVSDAEQEKAVRALLHNAPPERIEFFHIATSPFSILDSTPGGGSFRHLTTTTKCPAKWLQRSECRFSIAAASCWKAGQ